MDLRDIDTLMTDEMWRRLAVYYHDTRCTNNHTDMCGWMYEFTKNEDDVYEHDWTGWTHARYLEQAPKNLARELEQHPLLHLLVERS